MSIVKELEDIINLINQFKETKFSDFVIYLSEKSSEDRKFSVVREKFPDLINNIDSLEFLLEKEIIWIEIDGRVHPGVVIDSLYNLISKFDQVSD